MHFRNKPREDLDLNITPLIDVVFLLLIFFMVTTTFDRESEISITLPEASQEVVQTDIETIEISIDQNGRVFINDKSLLNTQMETIREGLNDALLAAGNIDEQPSIIINADAEASHQSVIRIMDVARQLGLRRITFATQSLQQD
ncbi:MAG: biopolymer transporter ExbD [Gammaproteobacteria bacterium]